MLPNILRFKANHLIDFFCLVGPYIVEQCEKADFLPLFFTVSSLHRQHSRNGSRNPLPMIDQARIHLVQGTANQPADIL